MLHTFRNLYDQVSNTVNARLWGAPSEPHIIEVPKYPALYAYEMLKERVSSHIHDYQEGTLSIPTASYHIASTLYYTVLPGVITLGALGVGAQLCLMMSPMLLCGSLAAGATMGAYHWFSEEGQAERTACMKRALGAAVLGLSLVQGAMLFGLIGLPVGTALAIHCLSLAEWTTASIACGIASVWCPSVTQAVDLSSAWGVAATACRAFFLDRVSAHCETQACEASSLASQAAYTIGSYGAAAGAMPLWLAVNSHLEAIGNNVVSSVSSTIGYVRDVVEQVPTACYRRESWTSMLQEQQEQKASRTSTPWFAGSLSDVCF